MVKCPEWGEAVRKCIGLANYFSIQTSNRYCISDWGFDETLCPGNGRTQSILLPEQLEDYVSEDNPVRIIDVFVDSLDLGSLGFGGAKPAQTGRPSYHPNVLLKIYIYGYLNRVQSSRRLEREAQRNIEVIWLTSRLTPDFKTIADFRKNNGPAISTVCRQFVLMCCNLDLFANTDTAIDGSKFKAVNLYAMDLRYAVHRTTSLNCIHSRNTLDWGRTLSAK
ncbi:Transposase [Collimonas sp. OK607]|nr:Transposase [Collimonas sp. OK607]